jgi:FAD/FMN-containing dehydrogenase
MKTQKGDDTYAYMQELKQMFDPNNILNPDKLL